MTPEEIARTEEKVNQLILGAYDVTVTEMPIAEAKKLGAMALFGEKYGETVRLCNVSGKSVELCGGTHISNTARIGLFKIISESSVAAGVRRIEAATGANVLELIRQDEALLARTCESLKAGSPSELPQKAEAITAQLKDCLLYTSPRREDELLPLIECGCTQMLLQIRDILEDPQMRKEGCARQIRYIRYLFADEGVLLKKW